MNHFSEAVKPIVKFIRILESLFRVMDSVKKITELLNFTTEQSANLKEQETGATVVNTIANKLTQHLLQMRYLLAQNLLLMVNVGTKVANTAATEANTAAKIANAISSTTDASSAVESGADAVNVGTKSANTAATNVNTGSKIANAISSAIAWLTETLGPIGLIAAVGAVSGIIALFTSGSKKGNNVAKMSRGGIIPAGFPNDTYPAFLESGEIVLPKPKRLPSIFESQAQGSNITELAPRKTDLNQLFKDTFSKKITKKCSSC